MVTDYTKMMGTGKRKIVGYFYISAAIQKGSYA